MNKIIIRFNRPINDREFKELEGIVENQKTNDKFINTTMRVNGDYAVLDLEFDEDGDITVL